MVFLKQKVPYIVPAVLLTIKSRVIIFIILYKITNSERYVINSVVPVTGKSNLKAI